jgi:hypothetical protein
MTTRANGVGIIEPFALLENAFRGDLPFTRRRTRQLLINDWNVSPTLLLVYIHLSLALLIASLSKHLRDEARALRGEVR